MCVYSAVFSKLFFPLEKNKKKSLVKEMGGSPLYKSQKAGAFSAHLSLSASTLPISKRKKPNPLLDSLNCVGFFIIIIFFSV